MKKSCAKGKGKTRDRALFEKIQFNNFFEMARD